MISVPPFCPGQLPKLSVVLDLDETLVHASFEPPEVYDFKLEIPTDGDCATVYVQKRPGVDEFIRTVSLEFEVFIFTASHINYAIPVVHAILPCFPAERVLWRGHCRLVSGLVVKDLTIFQRDLARLILVDNSPQSFLLQPQNGLLISTWLGDYGDTTLIGELLPFLRCCASVTDVRTVIAASMQ
jgi:Dullard-like phosphatase family protein